MRPLRIVLTADNHLGRFHDRLPPIRLERRRAWLRAGFQAAVERALSWPADLFVQAGDLFDTPDPRNPERAFVAEQLARLRLAGVRAFAVGGNHDTPRSRGEAGAVPQETYARLDGLRLLGNWAPFEGELVEIDGLRVAVGGLAWDGGLPAGRDPLDGFVWPGPRADLNLLVLHRGVEGYIHPAAEEPIVRLESIERLDGVHAVLAGHVHRHDWRMVGGRLLLVPGATERMTFGAGEGRPGFVELELTRGGVERLDHVPVPCQRRVELAINVEELPADDPVPALLARLEALRDAEALAKLKLEGVLTRDAYHALNLRPVWDFGAAAFFAFELDADGLEVADEPRRAGAAQGVRLSLGDELAGLAAELMAAADDDERDLLREARDRALAAIEAARGRR